MSGLHPLEFHAPGWHDDAKTPVVDGRYYDRAAGEVKTAIDGDGHQEYMGPPSVDIIVQSIHEDTNQCMFRAARAFPMEALLGYIMTYVVGPRKLQLDSVVATTYTIRVTLSHELTPAQFNEIAIQMANGIWDQPV